MLLFANLDLIESMNDKAERGKLACAVADHLFHSSILVPISQREHSRPGSPRSKIKLDSRVHGARFQLVGTNGIVASLHNLSRNNRGKASSPHVQLRIGLFAHLNHLKANVFSFSIAIEPQHERVRLPRLVLQLIRQIPLLARNAPRNGRREAGKGIDRVPVLHEGRKVHVHQMARHARHNKRSLPSPLPVVRKLKDGVELARPLTRPRIVRAENGSNRLGNAGFLFGAKKKGEKKKKKKSEEGMKRK